MPPSARRCATRRLSALRGLPARLSGGEGGGRRDSEPRPARGARRGEALRAEPENLSIASWRYFGALAEGLSF
jgi:hypothetical protein